MQQQRASDATWDPTVTMWVYEELVDGRKLTDIINCEHKNPKYVPRWAANRMAGICRE